VADITKVVSKTSPLQGTVTREKNAGGAGALGDTVYYAADGDAEVADASAAGTAKARGIVVAIQNGKTAFVAGDALTVAISGPVAGFSGMTPQDTLYQSDTAGAMADAAGTTSHIVGYAESATVVVLVPGA
jgi:hypothetical protein